jgi:cobaltochelatase CobT
LTDAEEGLPLLPPETSPPEQDHALEDDQGEPEFVDQADDSAPGASLPPLPDALSEDYRVFEPRYDRVVQAAALAAPREREALRQRLDGELEPYRRLVARLAHRLQRRILARQRRDWSFDQEEGLLDPARLARLVANPAQDRVFQVEEESRFKATAVTLLLDNSGSMRGRPITLAAITADILARALEQCGIKTEVLGYTTATWDGGLAAQAWKEQGAPTAPGRLNILRHIVYKAMDVPWRRARQDLGVMLKDGLLKENIDGEALWWAHQRLAARPEPRRLLIVISDGAPMDRPTLGANGKAYLDRHLSRVASWIERLSPVGLHAIGIGHQVSRYYSKGLWLRSVEELGETLPAKLGEWLD